MSFHLFSSALLICDSKITIFINYLQIFLQLGDISAAKRTLKKAYKMVLGVQDDDQGHLADLLKSGMKYFLLFPVWINSYTFS